MPPRFLLAARSRSSIVTSASRPAAAGPPRVPEGCSSLIAGLLLAARSSETVSRAQHGQRVSERQAAVCGLPGALAVRQPACCLAGRTAPPGGGWAASGGAGTAGGGEALAGVPGEKWLYISYTFTLVTLSSEMSQGCSLSDNFVGLCSVHSFT